MTYKIIIHPEAGKEIDGLDNRVKRLVFKQIKKLEQKPGLGAKLGHKMGMDLSDYRKLTADKKRIRIIYRIFEEIIQVQIVAVGKRESMQAYKKASSRTHDQ